VLNKSEMNLIWLGREKWGGHSMGAGGGGKGFKVEKQKAGTGNVLLCLEQKMSEIRNGNLKLDNQV